MSRHRHEPDGKGAQLRRVCVFCGANDGAGRAYRVAARRIGGLLAERGLGLVYGGARVGTMGEVAEAALAGGAEVVGVIPQALVDKEVAHTGLSRLEVVATMHDRKARMTELADAFVSLPGGYGTLDELFEVVTWAQLGLHRKPCGLLNVNGFWDPLVAHLDNAVAERFLRSEYRDMVLVDDDPERLLDGFEQYRPPETGKWIAREEV